MSSRTEKLVARLTMRPDGSFALCSPSVGFLREGIGEGRVIRGGDVLGHLEILGQAHVLIAPDDADGVVIEDLSSLTQKRAHSKEPLAYDEPFAVVDPKGVSAHAATRKAASANASDAGGLALKAPSSGRYYGRPGPGKEPFVKVGDTVTQGQTVALLEVMKTFNRVLYGGAGLPERARVKAIVPAEESDVTSGSVLLVLEPA